MASSGLDDLTSELSTTLGAALGALFERVSALEAASQSSSAAREFEELRGRVLAAEAKQEALEAANSALRAELKESREQARSAASAAAATTTLDVWRGNVNGRLSQIEEEAGKLATGLRGAVAAVDAISADAASSQTTSAGLEAMRRELLTELEVVGEQRAASLDAERGELRLECAFDGVP